MTSIVLMRDGVPETTLPKLSERVNLAFTPELIEQKQQAALGQISDGDPCVA